MPLRTAVALAFLACVLAGAARAEPPPPKDIPVVKTWGDLFDAEPIDAGGQKVRVGVEAESFPVGSGVLIYCLAEEAADHPRGSDVETVGPLSVRVTRGSPEMKQAHAKVATLHPPITGPRLYVGVISAGSSGPLSVKVRPAGAPTDQPVVGDDEPALAQRELKVTEERYHGWIRLAPARTPPPDGAPDPDALRVVRSTGRMCVPHRDGTRPFAFDGMDGDRPVRRKRTDALPTLFPAEPDAGLRLTFDGTSATVESDVPFPGARPEDGLMVRWTVNGKPFIPPPPAPQPAQMRQAWQQRNVGPKKLRLRLEWDPAAIGARPGDTVGAQMLFSPGGTRAVPHPNRMPEYPITAGGNADYVSRMTNVAEFVVRATGDHHPE